MFTLFLTVLVVHIIVSGSKCKFPVLKVVNRQAESSSQHELAEKLEFEN